MKREKKLVEFPWIYYNTARKIFRTLNMLEFLTRRLRYVPEKGSLESK